MRAPRRAQREGEPAPFIKWVGGKSRLAAELLARAPCQFKRYHEPFVGGAALFFRLRPTSALLTDLNADLVDCYRAVKTEVDAVIAALAPHRARHDEAYFYQTRARWNAARHELPLAERAALFVYLNKTCYNGLFRVNRSGEFNVPAGRYTNPAILDEAGLRAASRALKRVTLAAAPYHAVLDRARAGDFVYFDPPYVPLTATANFTSYTAGSFGADEQARLADVFRRLVKRGCHLLLSNSDTPLVRELYAGFRIDRVLCARGVNRDPSKRGAVAEVIVSGA